MTRSHPPARSWFAGAGVGIKRVFERSRTVTDRNPEKDPADWVTGDEPMTGPQESYLSTLAREAGQDVPDDLTMADASRMIDEPQEEAGRGTGLPAER